MELGRRDIDTVAIDLVVFDQGHACDVDAVRPDDLFGEVAGRIGHDGDRSTREPHMAARGTPDRVVLHPHVLGLVGHERPDAAQIGEHLLRLVGVHVHLEDIAGSDRDERVAQASQVGAGLLLGR